MKRKNMIVLSNGEEIDLMGTLPINKMVVDALRTRILELEDERDNQQPSKRARVQTTLPMASGSKPAAAHAPSKAEEKKRKLLLKKMFDRLKKECKSDSVKFQGSGKTIKFDEVFEQTDFENLFGGRGFLVQPTPENKPTSTVTIIVFRHTQQVADLFGDEMKALKGNKWSRGGMPARRMGGFFGGGGSTFTKSTKIGACDVQVESLEVTYSKNTMKCALKFEVAQEDAGECDDYW
ncbi:hypothetical protein BDN72DRAFT_800247 [Pluteus cervinus]|uniref:Uncharacterized protein n=1 Tax=Pluteus cervinus TaxID=181527 RepID=A0ACD3ALA2_9AGAR|nr:hypothetical protein BDN72DRAFT_800247 [Pluteus cervinus]